MLFSSFSKEEFFRENLENYYVDDFLLDSQKTLHITTASERTAKSLKLDEYYSNIKNYGGRQEKFIQMYPNIDSGYWHLLQTNIVILNSLVKNHQGGGIIDIGCGLGNFFGYLLHYFPNEKVIGVDNFSQIDMETVKTYQNSLRRVEITTIWPSEFYETAILVGVPLSDIYREINKLNIKYLYVETEYLLQYKNFKKLKNYKLVATNEIFSKYLKIS